MQRTRAQLRPASGWTFPFAGVFACCVAVGCAPSDDGGGAPGTGGRRRKLIGRGRSDRCRRQRSGRHVRNGRHHGRRGDLRRRWNGRQRDLRRGRRPGPAAAPAGGSGGTAGTRRQRRKRRRGRGRRTARRTRRRGRGWPRRRDRGRERRGRPRRNDGHRRQRRRVDEAAGRCRARVAARPIPSTGTSSAPLMVSNHKYYVKTPSPYDASKPYPVIFMFNPTGNPITWAEQNAGYESNGAKTGAIRVYPDPASEASGWGASDVSFFMPLYDAVTNAFCVDKARVFAAGESSGGDFSSILGCEYANVLRAVAPGATKNVSQYPLDPARRDLQGPGDRDRDSRPERQRRRPRKRPQDPRLLPRAEPLRHHDARPCRATRPANPTASSTRAATTATPSTGAATPTPTTATPTTAGPRSPAT